MSIKSIIGLLLHMNFLSCLAENYERHLIQFYNNPKYEVVKNYSKKHTLTNYVDTTKKILPDLDFLKEHLVHHDYFDKLKIDEKENKVFVFFHSYFKVRFEVGYRSSADTLCMTLRQFKFINKSFDLNNPSEDNKLVLKELSYWIEEITEYSLCITRYDIDPIWDLVPKDFDTARYMRCIDNNDTLYTCFTMLDSARQQCSHCILEKDLTIDTARSFLKSIINSNELNTNNTMCIFNAHDGVVLFKKSKPVFSIDLCFECGEVRFENLETHITKFMGFNALNAYKNNLLLTMLTQHFGSIKNQKRETVKYFNIRKGLELDRIQHRHKMR